MAEREGFEPPLPLRVNLISREQSKRDIRIDNHKFTEENNYPLPSLLLISANLCSQFLHNSFTATSAHQRNKLITYQVRRCKSACALTIFRADLIGKATPGTFQPSLQIDVTGAKLPIEALSGRWNYDRAAGKKNRLVSRRQCVFSSRLNDSAHAEQLWLN